MLRESVRGRAVCRFWLRLGTHTLTSLLPLRAGNGSLPADKFRPPPISAVRVEWHAVLDQLRSEINAKPAVAPDFTFSGQRRLSRFYPPFRRPPGPPHR